MHQGRRVTCAATSLVILATLAVMSAGSTFFGCATVGSKPAVALLNSRFTLAPGETTAIEGTDVFVRFDRVVEDSRCPADVACIQAGDGVIGITVRTQGRTPLRYQLHTMGPGPRAAAHGGVTITLEELSPKPVSSRAIPPKDYRAILRASR